MPLAMPLVIPLVGRAATVVLSVYCIVLLAACGNSDPSGSLAPTKGEAGQVKAVKGTVTASRNDDPARPLSVNDVVYVNDTIRTAPDSSAVILISHNNATWNLGAELEKRVNKSIVWSSARKTDQSLERTELVATAAAGRNTEREAAESVETLEETAKTANVESENDGNPPKSTRTESKTATTKNRGSGNGRNYKSGKGRGRLKKATEDDSRPKTLSIPDSPAPPQDSVGGGETLNRMDQQENAKAGSDMSPDVTVTIKRIASSCRAKHGGTGSLTIHLTVNDGVLQSVQFDGDNSFKATNKCIKKGVRNVAPTQSLKVILSFP